MLNCVDSKLDLICNCSCHQPSATGEDWEKDFDESFNVQFGENQEKVKDFIRQLLAREERAWDRWNSVLRGELVKTMFKETQKGQTHYQNDGCRIPNKSDKQNQKTINQIKQ